MTGLAQAAGRRWKPSSKVPNLANDPLPESAASAVDDDRHW